MANKKTEVDAAPEESEQPSELQIKCRAGVEKWMNDHLRNTAFSQHTEAWNVLQAALPLLGDYLAGEIS